MSEANNIDLGNDAVVVKVGSRVTCNPPPTDTDEDYLVYVKDLSTAVNGLTSMGFERASTPEQIEKYMGMGSGVFEFTSLWFGDLNYIVTDDWLFFERFLTATHVCKTLNLMRKEDRILVFGAIRGKSFSHMVDGGMLMHDIICHFKEKKTGNLSPFYSPDIVPMSEIVRGHNGAPDW